MAVLVLGPLLRYVGETEATIWVEADRPCRVEVLGHAARTFEVAGHHYALVMVTGLRPGSEHAYQVTLDGTVRWPVPDPAFGPSVLRTLDPGGPRRLAFGSCRVAELPPPRGRHQAGRERDHGSDALVALAHGLAGRPRESWPDSLLLIGDQVYADETGPATREFIGERRDPREPPGYQVADFEEYCALYREAWSAPAVRWLLSVVPTIMVFDDHDVHDDWNTSGTWRREFRARPWWQSRITGAFMSYWLYQHLGNLSPADLSQDDVWRQVQAGGDAAPVLRDLAERADAQAGGIRWSVRRDYGAVRVVVIDSRSRRVVGDDRRRLMADEEEWQWVTESSSAGLDNPGGFDHLVLATSLPLLLPRGIHSLEAWNEAVCAGAWGNRLRPAAERLRQAVDLEHWAAFGASFRAFETLLIDLAGDPASRLASITVISGDIHHNYLATVSLPPGRSPGTAVYQAVCSPLHNLLPQRLRFGHRLVTSGFGALITTAAARLARVPAPRIRWRVTDGPWFANMVAELRYDGRRARIRFDRTVPGGPRVAGPAGPPGLEPACEAELTPPASLATAGPGAAAPATRSGGASEPRAPRTPVPLLPHPRHPVPRHPCSRTPSTPHSGTPAPAPPAPRTPAPLASPLDGTPAPCHPGTLALEALSSPPSLSSRLSRRLCWSRRLLPAIAGKSLRDSKTLRGNPANGNCAHSRITAENAAGAGGGVARRAFAFPQGPAASADFR